MGLGRSAFRGIVTSAPNVAFGRNWDITNDPGGYILVATFSAPPTAAGGLDFTMSPVANQTDVFYSINLSLTAIQAGEGMLVGAFGPNVFKQLGNIGIPGNAGGRIRVYNEFPAGGGIFMQVSAPGVGITTTLWGWGYPQIFPGFGNQ